MAGKSYAIPTCSRGHGQMQKDDEGAWFCLTCADEWLERERDARVGRKSIGGVVLPTGVRDERRVTPSFRDLMPNRRMRRAMRGR